jgi:hypothetical protein
MEQEPEDHLGMTEEQWRLFQNYTHGYGEQDENGIDIALLRENLRLTPTERLSRLQQSHAFFVGVDSARNNRLSEDTHRPRK